MQKPGGNALSTGLVRYSYGSRRTSSVDKAFLTRRWSGLARNLSANKVQLAGIVGWK